MIRPTNIQNGHVSKYIITLLPGSGIGSAIVGILGALYYLKKNNIEATPLVNLIYASEPVKSLIQSFLDKDTISIVTFGCLQNEYKRVYNNSDEYKELFFVEETEQIYHLLNDCNIDFNIFIDFFNKLFIVKQNIQNELNTFEKYDICVNLRRGDKITLESHIPCASVQKYITEIEKLNLKDFAIFHTSDDYDTFLELVQTRKEWNVLTLNTNEEKGYFLAELNKQSNDYNYNHVLKFMKQLHIMTTSTYFIGTLSTSVGYLVQLLRQVRKDNHNIYV